MLLFGVPAPAYEFCRTPTTKHAPERVHTSLEKTINIINLLNLNYNGKSQNWCGRN